MGFSKTLFLLHQEEGFQSVTGAGFLSQAEQRQIALHFKKKEGPLLVQRSPQKRPWFGFWPVAVGNDVAACYAIGTKANGAALTGDEKKLLDLLTDRTALFFEERRLWEHLECANRQNSLGFMAAAMAHEIRNPLTALNTLVQLLPQKKGDEEFMDSFQKLMKEQIFRLVKLTDTYLNFSKPGGEGSEMMDLRQVIERTARFLEPLFRTKKVQHRIDMAASLMLKGNEHQMESLILNLLQNAFRSASEGGIVEISACVLKKTSYGPGHWARLQVKDNGEGIPKESLSKIFNPFYTTRGEGVGLGLAICRKIVENHRGHITVKSVPKKETVFSVFLPS